MNRFYLSLKVVGFLLLNILLWADIARGQMTVNPSSVNFGSVQTGASSPQALVLGNSGNSDLTIFQATISGQGFSLSGEALPLTLKAGQSAIASVVFAGVQRRRKRQSLARDFNRFSS